MSDIKSLWVMIVGEEKNRDPERYFVTITCFFASIFLIVLCLVHILMKLRLAPVFFAGGSALVMIGLYYFVRFRNCLFYPKLVLTIWSLVMLDFTWYAKFLSNGPVLFFILIFGALIIWVWEGKQFAIMLGIYFLNIVVLFLIDIYTPDTFSAYPDHRVRTVDIYLSFFMYASLLVFLLFVVKREFTRQKDLAVQSDRLKSTFLANMSHEIRTPMNAIVGFSQLLDDCSIDEDREQYAEIIRNSSENLLRMINDLLDLSKIESGDLELVFSDFYIEDVFRELKEMFRIELEKYGRTRVNLEYVLPDGNIEVCSDLLRVKQILTNLLSNAVKFTLQGEIVLACRFRENDVQFSVSDTGLGIREENHSRIFDRFSSFNTGNVNSEGSGLGLAIVEKIVDLLNGKIWFVSTPQKGSTFYFTIPRRALKGNHPPSTGNEIDMPIKNGNSKNPILVVEDNELSSKVLMEMLKRLEYNRELVVSGEDALDYLEKEPGTSLVLLDMKLPGMDGYTTARRIKQIKPEIKIIAQTANVMSGDVKSMMESGCDAYLSKPIELSALAKTIHSFLGN